jgi:hypothetical protein
MHRRRLGAVYVVALPYPDILLSMLRLSRLPRGRSINVRHTTPGHANPYFLDRARLLDPSHPAARLGLRKLPSVVCPQFTIRALPNAVLHEPVDFVPINPLLATTHVRARTVSILDPVTHKTRRHIADARVAALAQSGRRNVSLLFHTSKKATSKSCVIRRRLRSKMTAAIDLVVARNADAIHAPTVSPLASSRSCANIHP